MGSFVCPVVGAHCNKQTIGLTTPINIAAHTKPQPNRVVGTLAYIAGKRNVGIRFFAGHTKHATGMRQVATT
jgi:hypothetical protein